MCRSSQKCLELEVVECNDDDDMEKKSKEGEKRKNGPGQETRELMTQRQPSTVAGVV